MQARLKLMEKEFIDTVRRGIFDSVKDRVKTSAGPIKKRVGEIIERELLKSPTTRELLNGQLKHDFGLTDKMAAGAVDSIVQYMIGSLGVAIEIYVDKINVTLNLLPIGVDFINEITGGKFTTYNHGIRGEVDWAYWLITKGTQIVIEDYNAVDASPRPGRSGGNFLMKKGFGPFRVNPEHSGTLENNFITRAVTPHAKEIMEAILFELGRS